jgi:hypothetical protein
VPGLLLSDVALAALAEIAFTRWRWTGEPFHPEAVLGRIPATDRAVRELTDAGCIRPACEWFRQFCWRLTDQGRAAATALGIGYREPGPPSWPPRR